MATPTCWISHVGERDAACQKIRFKNNPTKRILSSQSAMQERPVIALLMRGPDYANMERELHSRLSGCRMETFGREWFKTTPEEIEKIWVLLQKVDDLSVGSQIRHFRRKLGLSQTELAKRANVRQATISNIERNEDASLSTLLEIARELRMKLTLVPY
jgi:HTH-type transcriptional regulator/antitoxin HipB